VLRSRRLRNPTIASTTLSCSAISSMTRHLHRAAAKSPQQRRRHHYSAALSPAWLGIYITLRPSHPGSIIVSITWQHCHQHDSTSTSHCGQIASATLSQHDSTAPSPACLDNDITQLLDRQHLTSAASRHAVSSYQYLSPLCFVPGPMQVPRYVAWHLREASTFRKLMFEDFKL
jgi:hypothetical protein